MLPVRFSDIKASKTLENFFKAFQIQFPPEIISTAIKMSGSGMCQNLLFLNFYYKKLRERNVILSRRCSEKWMDGQITQIEIETVALLFSILSLMEVFLLIALPSSENGFNVE